VTLNTNHAEYSESGLFKAYPSEPSLLPENVAGHTKKVHLLRRALSALRSRRGRGLRILDVGCGNGYAVTRFLAHPADRVLGIDMHEPSIRYAKQHFEEPGLEFQVQRVEKLSSQDRLFDVVVFADILEHVEQPEELLQSALHLLEPDGRVLVTIPNGYGPFEVESAFSRQTIGKALLRLIDLAVALINKFILRGFWSKIATPPALPYNLESEHIQFFTRKAFLKIAQNAGFTVVSSHNLSLFSGPFTNYFFAPFESFCHWNSRIAERLPSAWVSAWFFEFSAKV
jgi:2-polyprenyl-3-methyl-5-hydroxy-6-metoxy-1,4-benzoquinol methylase